MEYLNPTDLITLPVSLVPWDLFWMRDYSIYVPTNVQEKYISLTMLLAISDIDQKIQWTISFGAERALQVFLNEEHSSLEQELLLQGLELALVRKNYSLAKILIGHVTQIMRVHGGILSRLRQMMEKVDNNEIKGLLEEQMYLQ